MSASRLTKFRPTNVIASIKETEKSLRELKKVDPKTRYVLLFPDSGRFHVGTGLGLLGTPAEKVYDEASSLLKKDLLRLCLDGPSSEFVESLESRHVAAFVTSHATIAKLAHERPEVIPISKAAGGLGVGYINSLVFSGAMTFENGLDLVQRQAQKMAAINKVASSVRLLVTAKPAAKKIRICKAAVEHCLKLGIPKEIAHCSISRYLCEQKFEITGHEAAIRYIESEGERLLGIRYSKRLQTIDNYNSPLMAPVKEYLKNYIEQRLKTDPNYLVEPITCSVYSGTSACRTRTLDHIKNELCNFSMRPTRVEGLLTTLFKRPASLAQPNILVLWDRYLRTLLRSTNRRAYEASKLLPA